MSYMQSQPGDEARLRDLRAQVLELEARLGQRPASVPQHPADPRPTQVYAHSNPQISKGAVQEQQANAIFSVATPQTKNIGANSKTVSQPQHTASTSARKDASMSQHNMAKSTASGHESSSENAGRPLNGTLGNASRPRRADTANRPLPLYEVLGLHSSATSSEIKAAYKKRAQQTHPDKGGDPTGDAFKEVNKAYQILSNPMKRQRYDDTGRESEDMLKDLANVNPLDLFAAFFASEPKAADIRDVLSITEEQQQLGCTLEVDIEPEIVCADGIRTVEETVQVEIPPGIQKGCHITVFNKGCQERGKLPGDWVFIIDIKEEEVVMPEEHWVPGQEVQIVGLRESPQMNGQKGKLTLWREDKDRWEVEFRKRGSRETKLLKASNLQLTPQASEAKPRATGGCGWW